MPEGTRRKTTTVRAHPRRVRVSSKNLKGITIVDQHPRRIPGNALGAEEIKTITATHNKKNLRYPAKDDLEFPDGNKYDELIAIWVDYLGEAKDLIFRGIRQKDLKDPEIAIPLGIRWIFRKERLAAGKLGRTPTAEEVVLEYKGLLKSSTRYKQRALENFQKKYARLKAK
jgi:hypothetical protein